MREIIITHRKDGKTVESMWENTRDFIHGYSQCDTKMIEYINISQNFYDQVLKDGLILREDAPIKVTT